MQKIEKVGKGIKNLAKVAKARQLAREFCKFCTASPSPFHVVSKNMGLEF